MEHFLTRDLLRLSPLTPVRGNSKTRQVPIIYFPLEKMSREFIFRKALLATDWILTYISHELHAVSAQVPNKIVNVISLITYGEDFHAINVCPRAESSSRVCLHHRAIAQEVDDFSLSLSLSLSKKLIPLHSISDAADGGGIIFSRTENLRAKQIE
jgi:hypothetical protein